MRIKTRVFVILIVLSNVLGNSLLSLGMQDFGRLTSFSPVQYLAAFAHPVVMVGVCSLALSLASQAALLSWADLSYVMPVTASGYVLTALVGKLFLGDVIPLLHWLGIFLIAGGVALVTQTSPGGAEW